MTDTTRQMMGLDLMSESEARGLQVGTILHANGCTRTYGPRGGVTEHIKRWRVSGALQDWKRDATRWRIPIKYGMYDSYQLDHYNFGQFHTANRCPLEMNAQEALTPHMLTIKPIASQPGNAATDWPTTSEEYAPGKTGLDGAVGHDVTIHDWYGDYTGKFLRWSGGSTAPHVTIALKADKTVTMVLMAARSIDVY